MGPVLQDDRAGSGGLRVLFPKTGQIRPASLR